MNKEERIQLGHRFKVEKTPDHAIIDTSPKMFDNEEKALFCGHISGICKDCWDKIIKEGWKALSEGGGKIQENESNEIQVVPKEMKVGVCYKFQLCGKEILIKKNKEGKIEIFEVTDDL